ncbi:MAG: hypothetical protein ABSD20_21205 [Terriglobales bacterium]
MKNNFRLLTLARGLVRLAALTLSGVGFLAAQSADDTRLKQVTIFGRHSVRSGVASTDAFGSFAAQAYPAFTAASAPPSTPLPQAGYLTVNGAALETILGS